MTFYHANRIIGGCNYILIKITMTGHMNKGKSCESILSNLILAKDVFLLPNYSLFSKDKMIIPKFCDQKERAIYVVYSGGIDLGLNVELMAKCEKDRMGNRKLILTFLSGAKMHSVAITGLNPVLLLEMTKYPLRLVVLSGFAKPASENDLVTEKMGEIADNGATNNVLKHVMTINCEMGKISIPQIMIERDEHAASILVSADQSRVHQLYFEPSLIQAFDFKNVRFSMDYHSVIQSTIGLKERIIMMLWPDRGSDVNPNNFMKPFFDIGSTDYSVRNLF